MHIKFIQSVDPLEATKVFNIYWSLFSNRFNLFYLAFLIFGIILILTGYFNGYDLETSTSTTSQEFVEFFKNRDKTLINKIYIKQYNYHIYTGFGLTLFLWSGFMFFNLYRLKRILLKETLTNFDKLPNKKSIKEVEITNDYLSIKGQINESKYKWNAFKHFKIIDKYIYLFENNQVDSHFIYLHKNLMSNNEFEEFMSFIEKNIKK